MFIKPPKCPGCDAIPTDTHEDYCQVAAENIRRHGLGISFLTYEEAVELVLKNLNNAS